MIIFFYLFLSFSAWMSKIVELMQISEANIGNFDVSINQFSFR